MKDTVLNRRGFLRLAAAGGAGAAMLGSIPNASALAGPAQDRAEAIKRAMIRIEDEQRLRIAKAKGLSPDEIDAYWRVTADEVASLDHAFDVIRPATHLDHCFAFACLRPGAEGRLFADELARRRSDMAPALPDHPGLEPEWLLGHDTSRVLVFQEQIDTLLLSLNVAYKRSVCRIMRLRIWFGHMDAEDFVDRALNGNFPCRWGKSDLEAIHKALTFYIPHASRYDYCSSVVSRAM